MNLKDAPSTSPRIEKISVQFKTYQFETDKIRLHVWTDVENFTAFAFETSL